MSFAARPTESDALEVPFRTEELFYSRTDPRGVIRAGNAVFQRVAGLEWSRLVGAPHKVVRHPDMPRTVFRILWDAIQKGHPMGAYVKNRSATGGWYWVFAVILPVPDGYLSVRLKPSSQVFDKVRELYATIRAREAAADYDLEAGAANLRAMASHWGFNTYSNFMSYALGQEIAARDAAMGRVPDARTRALTGLNDLLGATAREQTALMRSFDSLQSIPNNMRLVASRLEPSGGPVSAISENYKVSSVGISDRLRSFVAGDQNLCEKTSRQVAVALFLLGAVRIMEEMLASGQQEVTAQDIDWAYELRNLREVSDSCAASALAALHNAVADSNALRRSSADIRRQMLGLDTIRVLGRVECGRLRDQGGGLSAAIDQLDAFHDDIKKHLEALMSLSDTISQSVVNYLRAA